MTSPTLDGRFNRIHAVCQYLRGKPCLRCPATETIENLGKCQKGCYGIASEVVNIVKHGNPWGKKGIRKHIAAWRKRFNRV